MSRAEHDKEIAAMFDRVASRYDRLNRVLSLGNDVGWRQRTAAFARLGPGEVALDVGVGTGDLAFDLLRISDPTSRVVGVDLSERMLDLVRARAQADPLGAQFEARVADGQALPFADASFDRVSAGFTIGTYGALDAGLRERRGVLRRGGRATVLGFSLPRARSCGWDIASTSIRSCRASPHISAATRPHIATCRVRSRRSRRPKSSRADSPRRASPASTSCVCSSAPSRSTWRRSSGSSLSWSL